MRITALNILSSVISVTLVRWIFVFFGSKIGFIVCLIFAVVLYLVADGLENIAKVMRMTVERLKE